MNHDVPSLRYLPAVQAENFADPSADAVAHNGSAEFLLHANAEAARRKTVRAGEDREIRAAAPLPAAINGFKVAPAEKPCLAGEGESQRIKWA
jgi:hypothetical protein